MRGGQRPASLRRAGAEQGDCVEGSCSANSCTSRAGGLPPWAQTWAGLDLKGLAFRTGGSGTLPGLPRLAPARGLLWLAHRPLFKLILSPSQLAIHSVLLKAFLPSCVHFCPSMCASPPPLSPQLHTPWLVHIPVPETLLLFSPGGSYPCCSKFGLCTCCTGILPEPAGNAES